MSLTIVVMAAGKGTRMKSDRPKVLHTLADLSLLQHVLDTCAQLGAARTVVITGHGAEVVEASIANPAAARITFARQMPQHGTGHAVQQAVPHLLDDGGTTLILNGDTPLIRAATAASLIQACGGKHLALLTINLKDPTGYGRILRTGDAVRAIVEQKDATPEQRQIHEVYTGMMAAPTAWLKTAVMGLSNQNAQGEYYLTDVVAKAVAQGLPVVAAQPNSDTEVLGVNSPLQLADLERRLQALRANALLEGGVRLADPARIDVRGSLTCGRDVFIDINAIFEGTVSLGDGVQIGANCVIRNASIARGAVIHPYTHIDGGPAVDGATPGVTVGEGALVGPFARLRPGAALGPEVHIGNFVEVKNSTLARGAKANHLAYLGDATVGERVNYGAGSITANYDGANKHRTIIGNDVHVGSNCVLVAPLTIGDGATIGGGSTINKPAAAGKLTVARARQATLEGWVRPQKKVKG
jgi:bifunctional UDP-N-acetylglucosamine pyrophosphorylase / glucosamine-1-phosphate N-acetyltransferase